MNASSEPYLPFVFLWNLNRNVNASLHKTFVCQRNHAVTCNQHCSGVRRVTLNFLLQRLKSTRTLNALSAKTGTGTSSSVICTMATVTLRAFVCSFSIIFLLKPYFFFLPAVFYSFSAAYWLWCGKLFWYFELVLCEMQHYLLPAPDTTGNS